MIGPCAQFGGSYCEWINTAEGVWLRCKTWVHQNYIHALIFFSLSKCGPPPHYKKSCIGACGCAAARRPQISSRELQLSKCNAGERREGRKQNVPEHGGHRVVANVEADPDATSEELDGHVLVHPRVEQHAVVRVRTEHQRDVEPIAEIKPGELQVGILILQGYARHSLTLLSMETWRVITLD